MNGENLEEERRAKKIKEEQRKQQVHADVSHYMKRLEPSKHMMETFMGEINRGV